MTQLRALSIMQPWAWLIVNGYKDIENRSWSTGFRGQLLIHAGKKLDKYAAYDVLSGVHPLTRKSFPFPAPKNDDLHLGGIVGEAEIVDCVEQSDSDWFVGRYGLVMLNARPLPFRACKGALGFFLPASGGPSP
jgi:hypothetical protein